MEDEEFDTYKFTASTEVFSENKWRKITAVCFDFGLIMFVDGGYISHKDVEDIKN